MDGVEKQERLETPKTFTREGQDNTKMSSTGGGQTRIGLKMAPALLKLKKHFKTGLCVNKLKIQSTLSYAVSGILFPCIDTNSLTQWLRQQHMM